MTKDPRGKGANIAMAACRARDKLLNPSDRPTAQLRTDKIEVFLNGAVGAGEPGSRLLAYLERGDVDVSRVQVMEGEATATGIVMLETAISDSRSFAYHGAVSTRRMPNPGTTACLTSNGEPDLVVANLIAPQEEVAKAFTAAAREGVATVFNPLPIQEMNRAIFANVTHLMLNQSEAAALRQVDADSLKAQADWDEATDFSLRLGVSNVVLTLAVDGAYYATASGESGHVEAVQDVQVVDATGAGDFFIGAYAVEYVTQRRLGVRHTDEAIRFACHAAAWTIQHMGAQDDIPD
ncbi:hypothetical protein B0A48_00469 [Cryoendolithus antarcticus]|uniref:Carbohydrate kinase PfkB domain-containing protein n=1 Tax=Cryoendolithus antarcticus TaxID=1507870 RepID=A0A1V8TUS0_9PEZI|nr:hypothetical protein B0A48_00469 [Cryoendolithus antarcticus]